MRTSDFSIAPKYAHGESMFVGATKYKSPLSWIRLARRYKLMIKDLRVEEGYCWHRTFYIPPFTLGTIAAFKDKDSLLKFARSKSHHNLIKWLMASGSLADGGFIRIYNADEKGYSNGVWRAEDRKFSHIENFTPLVDESDGPKV